MGESYMVPQIHFLKPREHPRPDGQSGIANKAVQEYVHHVLQHQEENWEALVLTAENVYKKKTITCPLKYQDQRKTMDIILNTEKFHQPINASLQLKIGLNVLKVFKRRWPNAYEQRRI